MGLKELTKNIKTKRYLISRIKINLIKAVEDVMKFVVVKKTS